MINEKTLALMKRGTYLVNTARAKLVHRDAVAKALESGQLAGYAGGRLVSAAGAREPPVADHAA
jgi:lactate dehydrogenase-like 2-hydroxyacid dehydrogenase